MLLNLYKTDMMFVPIGDKVANDEFYDKIPRNLYFIDLLRFIDSNGVTLVSLEGEIRFAPKVNFDVTVALMQYDRVYVVRKMSSDETEVYDHPYFIPEDENCQVISDYANLLGGGNLVLYGYFKVVPHLWCLM